MSGEHQVRGQGVVDLELPLEVSAGKCGGLQLTGMCASVVLIVTLFFFSVIMDKYQEQPHLLDPHLGKSSS